MMMNVKVFQMKHDEATYGMKFFDYKFIAKNAVYGKMNAAELKSALYTEVGSFEIDAKNVEDAAEKMFTISNAPAEITKRQGIVFKMTGLWEGHSISVSDILEIEGVNVYCEGMGFRRLA